VEVLKIDKAYTRVGIGSSVSLVFVSQSSTDSRSVQHSRGGSLLSTRKSVGHSARERERLVFWRGVGVKALAVASVCGRQRPLVQSGERLACPEDGCGF
jgi:hypothetical protein